MVRFNNRHVNFTKFCRKMPNLVSLQKNSWKHLPDIRMQSTNNQTLFWRRNFAKKWWKYVLKCPYCSMSNTDLRVIFNFYALRKWNWYFLRILNKVFYFALSMIIPSSLHWRWSVILITISPRIIVVSSASSVMASWWMVVSSFSSRLSRSNMDAHSFDDVIFAVKWLRDFWLLKMNWNQLSFDSNQILREIKCRECKSSKLPFWHLEGVKNLMKFWSFLEGWNLNYTHDSEPLKCRKMHYDPEFFKMGR